MCRGEAGLGLSSRISPPRAKRARRFPSHGPPSMPPMARPADRNEMCPQEPPADTALHSRPSASTAGPSQFLTRPHKTSNASHHDARGPFRGCFAACSFCNEAPARRRHQEPWRTGILHGPLAKTAVCQAARCEQCTDEGNIAAQRQPSTPMFLPAEVNRAQCLLQHQPGMGD